MSCEALPDDGLLDILSERVDGDDVPPGWFRIPPTADRLNIAPNTLRKRIQALVARGKATEEHRRFRVKCFDGSFRAVMHYKVEPL